MALLYRIREEQIFQLYDKYPSRNYQKDLVLIAKDAIQKVPENYESDDFFKKRKEIAAVMTEKVNVAFKALYCEVITLQVLEIQLNAIFENQKEDAQVKKRDSQTAEVQQQLEEIQGEISVIQSGADAAVAAIIASAEGAAEVTVQQKIAEGNNKLFEAQGEAYEAFLDPADLNFTQPELLRYLYLEKLRLTTADDLTVYTSGGGISLLNG